MPRAINVEVTLDEVKGNQTRLIKKFIKKCKKEKIIEEFRENAYFEKPSTKRRRAKIKKLRNAQKAEMERSKKYTS
jgi:ribosomal protein S21